MDWSAIQTILILVTGAGVFLRLAAKEKHRREKYLQLRVEEHLQKLREEEKKREAEKKRLEKQAREAEEAAERTERYSVLPR